MYLSHAVAASNRVRDRRFLPALLPRRGMRRRTLLRTLALAAAGLAGCTSSDDHRGPPPTRPSPASPTQRTTRTPTPDPGIPTPTPTPFVEELQTDITAVTVEEDASGQLVATVPVENTTDVTLDADLVVTVEGTDTYTTRQRISVPPAVTEHETVLFGVDWDEAAGDTRPQVREILLLVPGATLDE